MNQPQALYQLQQLETTLDDGKKRLAEIEVALEDNELVRAAREVLETHEQEHRQADAAVNDMELELAALATKVEEVDKLLHSGDISNPKELQQREQELDSLKRRHANLQEDLVGARETREQTEAVVQQTRQEFEQVKQEAANQNEDLQNELSILREALTVSLKKRKMVLKTIDTANHKLYKKLKPMKNGLAVTRLDGGMCAACHVEQNQTVIHQVRQSDEVIRCQNCGRILVDRF